MYINEEIVFSSLHKLTDIKELTKIIDGYTIAREAPKFWRSNGFELLSIMNMYINEEIVFSSVHKLPEADGYFVTLAFENIANVQIQMPSEHKGKHD